MKKEIKINITDGDVILIPDSNTKISSFDHAITVPVVATESSGTSIRKFAQILEFNFANHIHDLCSAPIIITANWISGTSTQFEIYAVKQGESNGGMSPWYVYTSNGWKISIAESVLERTADLNQCIEALVIKAAGESFCLRTKDRAIKRSAETLRCLRKN